MKKPLSSIFDYLILTVLVSIAIILILYFNGSKSLQEIIILGLSISYIVWGIVHHAKLKTLHTKVILEYVLFAVLGCIIVTGLLK